MKYFIGAYASSPNVSGWDAELETRYYDKIKSFDNIAGLEHPFSGELHNHDEEWFLNNIDPSWEFVFTCIPGIMGAIGKNPHFGIASDDESGRQEALSFMKKARDAVAKLNAHSGKHVVRAVEIQTSPNKSKASSSKASLQKSLSEMLSWDWQGAKLVIEHCDAYVEGQTPSKGFLTITDEVDAIKSASLDSEKQIGICINWGRSAIETRSTQGVVEHIKIAKDAGLLSGLMFSGASSNESDYGVWSDSHMPSQALSADGTGEASSLMSPDCMNECLQLADAKKLLFLGVKIGIRPRSADIEERLSYNQEAFTIIDKYIDA